MYFTEKSRALEDMTLEELWELFPIVLIPHQPQWRQWAEEEIGSLTVILTGYEPIINHVGSTAVPAIWAKPIIDILVQMPSDVDWGKLRTMMEAHGYICMSTSDSRMSFNKGYTPQGFAERVFHIHFRRLDDNDEIYFRDYLISHPNLAKEYESLKLSLLPEYRHNRDGYTEAKSEFVKKVMALCKRTK
ncbi:MAG: GrpB family protein [Muribaculaceae bacterium]|nr:GrpB family protein [Muribaculaceae bacterium]